MFTTDYDDILAHEAALEAKANRCKICGREFDHKLTCPNRF